MGIKRRRKGWRRKEGDGRGRRDRRGGKGGVEIVEWGGKYLHTSTEADSEFSIPCIASRLASHNISTCTIETAVLLTSTLHCWEYIVIPTREGQRKG